jgi:hypothetical protein
VARKLKPPTNPEIDAIKKAEARWLGWRDIDAVCPPDIPDKQAYTKLKAASKQMAKAIDLFVNAPGSGETSRLLMTMQELQCTREPQSHYMAMLNGLVEPLQLLERSCASLGGRGGRLNPAVIRWVGLAADAWTEFGNPAPTPKGRFFKALTAKITEEKSIPAVTEESTREALEHWRKVRQFP